MKILKIFGLVVGIHAVAFVAVFAVPGCRATRRQSPPPLPAAQTGQTGAASARAADAEPLPGVNAPGVSPGRPAPVQTQSPVSYTSSQLGAPPAVRFNPTRPGSGPAVPPQPTALPDTTSGTTYTVGSGDTLWKIAKANGLSIRELAAANHLNAEAPLRPGQKLTIPGKANPMSTPAAAPDTAPASTSGDTIAYRVRSGDSLALIARRAGTTTAAIKTLNNLKNDNLRAGQQLTIPAGPGTAAALGAAPDPETGAGSRAVGTSTRHLVKSGENLGMIARRYGVTRRELAVANNITNPQNLRAGQELVIPGVKAPAQTPPPAEVAPEAVTPAEDTGPVMDSGNPIMPSSDASPIGPSSEPEPPVIQVEETSPIGAPRD